MSRHRQVFGFLSVDGIQRVTGKVLRILDAVGVSPYHTCYEVKNLQEAIAQLRQQRFMLVNGPVPACALENREIAFMFNKNYGLIELVEAFS